MQIVIWPLLSVHSETRAWERVEALTKQATLISILTLTLPANLHRVPSAAREFP